MIAVQPATIGPDALRILAPLKGTLPAQQDIAIRRGSAGDYAAVILQILQADGETPVPLSGATVTLTFALGDDATLTKSTADGSMALDATTSTVTWLPTSAETLAIASGRIDTYDLSILFPNGSSGPYMTGFVIGLDDGDAWPWGCSLAGDSSSSTVRVIKVLVPGTPGPAGNTTITKTAVSAVSGHKVIKAVLGGFDTASSDDPASFGAIVGISTSAAAQGVPLAVQTTGAEIQEVTWAWLPGKPVFLGLAGALTQVPVLTGFLQQIGVATTPTSIFVDVQQPIQRA